MNTRKNLTIILLGAQLASGCASSPPYVGVNPQNPQFERGLPFRPLDDFGDLISKPYQLLFWTLRYGNHRVSAETEQAIAEFLAQNSLTDVKVAINQWAPHKELARVFKNKHIAWPYKILFLPSTLIASLLGRPLSGLLISDYYDPGSNTIHIFSDEISIALHEGAHAKDFASQRWKGSYALLRILPGINVFQEGVASDEAFYHLEATGQYEELLRSYKILYPAYSTYILSYFPFSPFSLLAVLGFGHAVGRGKANDKRQELEDAGKMPAAEVIS